MIRELVVAARLLVVLTLVTGLVYPAVVTMVARLAFPWAAAGSFVDALGRPVPPGPDARGSALIGQPFGDGRYFWGRLSATTPVPYNAASSGGSNYGPLNPAVEQAARGRLEALGKAGSPAAGVPADLVTASGSGLDPHISPAAAEFQVARVARARGVSESVVRDAVRRHTLGRQLGLLGEPRVNVLLVNLDLDRLR